MELALRGSFCGAGVGVEHFKQIVFAGKAAPAWAVRLNYRNAQALPCRDLARCLLAHGVERPTRKVGNFVERKKLRKSSHVPTVR